MWVPAFFLRARRVGSPGGGGWAHKSKASIVVCEYLSMGLEAWDRDLAVLLIVHGSRASRYCSLVYRHVFSSLYEDALQSFPQGVNLPNR